VSKTTLQEERGRLSHPQSPLTQCMSNPSCTSAPSLPGLAQTKRGWTL